VEEGLFGMGKKKGKPVRPTNQIRIDTPLLKRALELAKFYANVIETGDDEEDQLKPEVAYDKYVRRLMKTNGGSLREEDLANVNKIFDAIFRKAGLPERIPPEKRQIKRRPKAPVKPKTGRATFDLGTDPNAPDADERDKPIDFSLD
jgi:hypothetical protein